MAHPDERGSEKHDGMNEASIRLEAMQGKKKMSGSLFVTDSRHQVRADAAHPVRITRYAIVCVRGAGAGDAHRSLKFISCPTTTVSFRTSFIHQIGLPASRARTSTSGKTPFPRHFRLLASLLLLSPASASTTIHSHTTTRFSHSYPCSCCSNTGSRSGASRTG